MMLWSMEDKMPKISIELEVSDAQEVASTLRTTVKKIDWVLDNKPPSKPGASADLDSRAQQLTKIAEQIETMLHDRARANANVVPMKVGDKNA
jgi:hypothetical protein